MNSTRFIRWGLGNVLELNRVPEGLKSLWSKALTYITVTACAMDNHEWLMTRVASACLVVLRLT